MPKRIYKSQRFASREVIASLPPSFSGIPGRDTLREATGKSATRRPPRFFGEPTLIQERYDALQTLDRHVCSRDSRGRENPAPDRRLLFPGDRIAPGGKARAGAAQ